jgi:DNA-binding response OmpR family regulator
VGQTTVLVVDDEKRSGSHRDLPGQRGVSGADGGQRKPSRSSSMTRTVRHHIILDSLMPGKVGMTSAASRARSNVPVSMLRARSQISTR